MFILIILINVALSATDPWHRPMHVRAIPQHPSSWSNAISNKVRHRIWWDESNSTAKIELQTSRGWVSLTKDANPGWLSKPLPRNAVFRVWLNERSLRWSVPVSSRNWVSPVDWAALSGIGLRGTVVSEMAFEDQSNLSGGRVWGAGMRGGLVEMTAAGEILRIWSQYDGLPDDQVISVDVNNGKTLVGTANGALLIHKGKPLRVWDSQLADSYVQTVRFNGEDMWLGTFRGLNRVRFNSIHTLLKPMSVFSLEPAANRGMWVGYNKTLSHFDATDSLSQISWPKKVHDIIDDGNNRYISSEAYGILRLDGKANILHKRSGLNLALGDEGLWVARGSAGLLRPDGAKAPLAGDVWSVGRQGDSLWVGGSGGLQRFQIQPDLSLVSLSELSTVSNHVDRSINSILELSTGLFVGGSDGLWTIGEPHRHAGNLIKAAKGEILRLFKHKESIWALTPTAIFNLEESGVVRSYVLPEKATDGAFWLNRYWISTNSDLYRFDFEQKRAESVHKDRPLESLSAGRYGLWGLASDKHVHRIHTKSANRHRIVDDALSVAPSGMSTCLGTTDGLWRFWHARKKASNRLEDPMGKYDDGVKITAVAGDGKGGCWFADEHGTIGLVNQKDQQLLWRLSPDSPKITQLIPGEDGKLWVLSEGGLSLLFTNLAF